MDIIILALISGFVLFKLYSALGKDDGDGSGFTYKHHSQDNDKVVSIHSLKQVKQLPEAIELSPQLQEQPQLAAILQQIYSLDRAFSEVGFLKGATKAFELILKAFYAHDKSTLDQLVSPAVRDQFLSITDHNRQNNHVPEHTLVSIREAKIIDASLQNKLATIKVHFLTEQINIVRDQNHNIIQGNPSKPDVMEDIWSFARDVTSKNPSWLLVATRN